MKLTVIEEYEAKSSDSADIVIARGVEGHLYARKGGVDKVFTPITDYTVTRDASGVAGIEFGFGAGIANSN